MTHLQVVLAPNADGLVVRWRLDGAVFECGETVGQLGPSIAGAPTIHLESDAVTASDAAGAIPLKAAKTAGPDGEPVRVWRAERSTIGSVEVSYLARPVDEEPRPATPPLELRREGAGLSGAVKCFLVLPPALADPTFEVRWEAPADTQVHNGWIALCSLGEHPDSSGEVVGEGLEVLGDTYLMCGDLADHHYRAGDVSVWWLTPPGLEIEGFASRLEQTHRMMSSTFDAPMHPYRVFLRASPHRGLVASAHPASFVIATNPVAPPDQQQLYVAIAHELVHEWLHMDGLAEDVTWFNEGAADYYSLVLPLRGGIIDADTFLREVNLASRLGYASTLRNLSLDQAASRYWSDFRAHRLPYVRGMFYLADLDARLGAATHGRNSVDDVVRHMLCKQRAGNQFGLEEWSTFAGELLGTDEQAVLERFVFVGDARPTAEAFGPAFEGLEVEAPVVDMGFDVSTFVTGRVAGLVPGGVADSAGLRNGDLVELPTYAEAVALSPGEGLPVGVVRDGTAVRAVLPPSGQSVAVTQWRAVARPNET